MIPFQNCSDVRVTVGQDFARDDYMLRIDFLRTKKWVTLNIEEDIAKRILTLMGESEGLANE